MKTVENRMFKAGASTNGPIVYNHGVNTQGPITEQILNSRIPKVHFTVLQAVSELTVSSHTNNIVFGIV